VLGRFSALIVAVLLATVGFVTGAGHAGALPDPGSAEARFLVLTNQARANVGLPPLVRDAGLDGVARQWSGHMAGVFAANGGQVVDAAAPTDCNHTALCHRPDLANALSSIDTGWHHGGENIGVGGDVEALQGAFVESSGHYANIVGPYDRVGVGVVAAGDRIWVTLDFMDGPPIGGYTGLDTAVPTGTGPGVASVQSLSGQARFSPAQPQRLLDTRSGTPVPGGASLPLRVAGVGQVPGNAVGVVVNVTATGSGAAGYLTVYPCGASPPTASNVNFVAGSTVPNLVTSALGAGQLCVFASVTTHVIVDLAGWYRTDGGASFAPIAPQRIFDSRSGAAGQSYSMPLAGVVGDDAVAVAINLTATQPGAAGYLAAYPCGGTVPLVSNVNYTAGQTIPNSAIVPIGANRSICVFSSTPAHVIVDLSGAFGSGGAALTPVVPARLLDTRAGTGGWFGPLGHTQAVNLGVAGRAGVPGNAVAVVLNVTVTDTLGAGYLTVYPCGGPVPVASNLNFMPGDTRANLVTVQLGANGDVCFYSYSRASVIADITGYLT
jgi:Cysteine-rich secretory protein family